jgi:hypothetical protein
MIMTFSAGTTMAHWKRFGILLTNNAGEELVMLNGHVGVRKRMAVVGPASVTPYTRALV